jgi:hypothetical protein
MRNTFKSDKGTTLVEFSIIFMLMMMVSIGAFEWGMGFRDRLSVSQSVREGARVGAAVGDSTGADCRILEAGAGSLAAVGGKQVKEVWIYQSDELGVVGGAKQRYRPAVGTDDPLTLTCSGGWYPIQTSWAASSRDNSGPTRDWLGVRVVLDHEWKTDFLWWNGTVEWQESAVFHLEPRVVS